MRKSVKAKIIGLVITVILSLLAIVLFVMNVNATHKEIDKAEINQNNDDYQYFKDNTVVIKGKVNERYIQNDNGEKERYLVVSYNDDSRKLVSVSEKQFHEYKQGSKVNFRIDRASNNAVVVDLDKHKDIKSKEAFDKYKKQQEGKLWGELSDDLSFFKSE